jgi:hypothetical protein
VESVQLPWKGTMSEKARQPLEVNAALHAPPTTQY